MLSKIKNVLGVIGSVLFTIISVIHSIVPVLLFLGPIILDIEISAMIAPDGVSNWILRIILFIVLSGIAFLLRPAFMIFGTCGLIYSVMWEYSNIGMTLWTKILIGFTVIFTICAIIDIGFFVVACIKDIKKKRSNNNEEEDYEV